MTKGPHDSGDESSLRLDLFLKRTRLIKRRTVTKKMCEAGLISVNGEVSAKPAKPVRPGDTISLPREKHVRVIKIPEEKNVKDSTALYEVLKSTPDGANDACKS